MLDWPGQTTLAITWGHNQDHRSDLKQLLHIPTVSNDGGVPVHFRVESGSTVDDQTHQETWELLCELAGRRDFLYVADCKLATAENMAYLHQRDGRFINRRNRWRCTAESGSTLRPTGRRPVYYNYRATLISYRSCLKPIDTLRGANALAADLLQISALASPGTESPCTALGNRRITPTPMQRSPGANPLPQAGEGKCIRHPK